jgi:hypothetical protein
MKSLRSSSMIAAAMSVVRPAGRRRAVAAELSEPATDYQVGASGETALTRNGAGPTASADRAAPMSCSLIGW